MPKKWQNLFGGCYGYSCLPVRSPVTRIRRVPAPAGRSGDLRAVRPDRDGSPKHKGDWSKTASRMVVGVPNIILSQKWTVWICESKCFLTLLFRMTWKLPVPGLPIASHKSTVEPSQYLEGQHHGGCPGRARTQTHRVVGAHLQVWGTTPRAPFEPQWALWGWEPWIGMVIGGLWHGVVHHIE